MLKICLTHVYHVFTQTHALHNYIFYTWLSCVFNNFTIKYLKTKAVSLAAFKSILKKKYFIPFTKCISSPLKRSLI